MKKDIGLRGASRRDFVRGVFTASAALGLGPTRALDMLERLVGEVGREAGAEHGDEGVRLAVAGEVESHLLELGVTLLLGRRECRLGRGGWLVGGHAWGRTRWTVPCAR